MFTVKHVDLNGTETIRTAAEVKYLAESNTSPAQVQLSTGAIVTEFYSDGTVYVMNDAGSTVAKYDMNRGSVNAATAQAKYAPIQGGIGSIGAQAINSAPFGY